MSSKDQAIDGAAMTFDQIGKEIGLSRNGAKHVYMQALKKLKGDKRLNSVSVFFVIIVLSFVLEWLSLISMASVP